MRHLCLAALLVAVPASPVVLSPASAQDYSYEQERYCTGDAFRLCMSDIPDIPRVTACMTRRQDELSPACRAVFIASAPPSAVRAPAPAPAKQRGKKMRPPPMYDEED